MNSCRELLRDPKTVTIMISPQLYYWDVLSNLKLAMA